MPNKNWKRVDKDETPYIKTYEHVVTGAIRVAYPKGPMWAQKVAMTIWRDATHNGLPTRKGTKDIVRGYWAKMIAEAAK